MRKNLPKHLKLLIDNISEVERLLAIQDALTGITRRRYNVETLNASCIVLLVACWESYIEDVVGAAFDVLLDNAKTPLNIPLDNYKNKQLRSFNTPKSENIDTLCSTLLNIHKISRKFNVPRRKNSDVRGQLDSLIKLRGSIAHRVKATKSISHNTVVQHISLIGILAENMNNIINDHIKELIGSEPWGHISVAI